MHLKTSRPEDESVPALVGDVEESGYGCAEKSEKMGRGGRRAIIAFCRFLMEAGLTSVIRLRSDQGPEACAVAQEVAARRHPARTTLETSPRACHSSLGGAERRCRTIGGQVRAFRIEIEERWGCKILAASPIMTYVIRHSARVGNRFQPTRGLTPYERVQGHPVAGSCST
eukprot:3357625-Heterocapsa_arctica.AAC.1